MSVNRDFINCDISSRESILIICGVQPEKLRTSLLGGRVTYQDLEGRPLAPTPDRA